MRVSWCVSSESEEEDRERRMKESRKEEDKGDRERRMKESREKYDERE